jgi:SAM-dependent methyltransferase
MSHDFDRDYWERRWTQSTGEAAAGMDGSPPNPYLIHESSGLVPGTALDAGCGAGAEAIWLAGQGWQVTAADISADALARAARRAEGSGVGEPVTWIEADLTVWDPGRQFDLVTTHYAHPAMAQLAFYERIAGWVAPGGCLLIVGHRHADSTEPEHPEHHQHPEHPECHKQHPPAEASVTLSDVTAGLDLTAWTINTAAEHVRTLAGPGGQAVSLHDVVLRATRRR